MNTGAPWPGLDEARSRVLVMQTKPHQWAKADPGRRFDDLANLVYDPAFLVVAWNQVRGNKGARTAGVDGVAPRSIVAGVEALLGRLRDDLKAGRFVPQRVREKAIPKASGKVRRLGIPTVADRVVQASLKLVLEPIFEADFQPCSYGFRPKRRAQDAIAEIHHLASPNRDYLWVFEADIKACFDEIDHTALMGRVRDRIGDKRVLGWVKAFLRAGVLTEEGLNRQTITGTPQGGILSPLLANIALSVLDEHFAARWAAMGPEWTRAKRRRAGEPVMRLVRYADDFVVMVHGTRDDAEALWGEVAAVLAPMGLRLSEEKTRVCHIDEGFDFLGWRIQRRAWRSRTGKRAIYTYPSKKALASVMAKVRSLTRRAKHRTLADLLRRLNPVLRGWCNYFRHGVSARTFSYVDHYAFWRIVGWLRKRHAGLNMHTLVRRHLPGWEIRAGGSRCSGHERSPSSATATGAPTSRRHGQVRHQDRPHQRHDTWRAGCGGSRTSGSEGGPEKPANRKAGRALRPDPYTYVPTRTGMAYVCFIVDAFSRRIVGWRAASTMRTAMVLDALEMARQARGSRRLVGLVTHSDAGSQFTSVRFTERLDEIGARPSIGTVADSYDNALAETVNGLYKAECVYGPDATGWDDVDGVELATLSWVHWYNHQRLHGHCGDVPPVELETTWADQAVTDPAAAVVPANSDR